jgi:ABC-2 type transport system permease protein
MSAGIVTMSSSRQSGHRVAALFRAEGVLLRRNRVALLNALVLPAALAGWLKASGLDAGVSRGMGAAMLVTGLTAFALLLPVYYNLVTALVARREQLVLKRLRAGESTDAEILAGTAAPAVALAWIQVAVAAVAAVAVFGMNRPANALLVLAALILGTAVFVLLAAVTAAVTRTVEMAQLTTAPVLMLSFAFGGLLFPLSGLPGPLRSLGQALPLTRVLDLLRLGLTGTAPGGGHLGLAATFGAAAVPVLVLAAWIAAGGWAARRWFRWEPRR